MRALRAFLATVSALLVLTTAIARADDRDWAALAQRLAARDLRGDLSVTLGAEPPGFVFPLSARPALPVLGATWFASSPNAPPLYAHIFYAPTAHTGTASEALFAELRAAGYTRLPDRSAFPSYPRQNPEATQQMCPRDLQRPAIDVTIEQFDGLPALDLTITARAESTLCRDAVVGPQISAHLPVLTGIPGVTVHPRIGEATPVSPAAPFSTATVETALAPVEAVAKFAEKFTANGWSARTPVVAGKTITQRFAFTGAVRRSEALLVLDRRGVGAYNLMIALTDTALPAAR